MKTQKPIRAFYLDIETRHSAQILRTLKRYSSTIEVQHDGQYREGPEYSRVYIATTLTESALESYLYKNKNTTIVGIIETTVR